MNTIWTKESDTILSVGASLEDVGIRNWALTQEQALIALDQFEAKGIAILGGDVYEIQKGRLQANYDNWYYDRKYSESKMDFISRSVAKARAYISNYNLNQDAKYFFGIVPDS